MSLMSCTGLAAEDGPRPPCGSPPNPSHAALNEQPNVRVWSSKQGVVIAPKCGGIPDGEFRTVIALSGTFQFEGDTDKLLERLGSVSAMQGVRYWSVTDGNWRVLITQSAAAADPKAAQRRADFSAEEMKRGQNLYYVQHDSRSTGEVVYRMRTLEATQDRLVVDIENVSAVRSYILTVFKPGELRTVHYLNRTSSGGWRYYALTLIRSSQSDSHMPSLVNRAAALYRFVAGQRTDQEPPLAR